MKKYQLSSTFFNILSNLAIKWPKLSPKMLACNNFVLLGHHILEITRDFFIFWLQTFLLILFAACGFQFPIQFIFFLLMTKSEFPHESGGNFEIWASINFCGTPDHYKSYFLYRYSILHPKTAICSPLP